MFLYCSELELISVLILVPSILSSITHRPLSSFTKERMLKKKRQDNPSKERGYLTRITRKRLILTSERKVLWLYLFWTDNISHSARFVPLIDFDCHL